ncbi:hypothetical protein QCB45_00580 [Thiomicrorhabdus sp. ZW0627]|uniref:hypothetical protein n=1 Tax=Thiomicrorhabdus sp. ZW0627 TaxID=3039774 RepID=UPI0024363666|nr:hypothetical protein [Thiomicrorhabdus sp. ZW0627]MDG6772821.1 hypothetical protein [Thiomicrorhabdus sp. ZW0627]
MKSKWIGLVFSGLMLTQVATGAQAGVWENIKEDAAKAWESTKETASGVADDVVDGSKTGYEKAKKLGDKETYTNAWEGLKHSAKNPNKAPEDEAGIPQD